MVDCYLGEIRIFAGNYAPQGWHLCDGAALPIAGNEALYSLLGTIYGGTSTTFQLPDLRGRLPVHVGQGAGLQAYALGAEGGAETVGLTAAQLGGHTHSFLASSAAAVTATPGANMTYGTASSPWTLYIPPNASPGPSAELFAPAEILPAGGVFLMTT